MKPCEHQVTPEEGCRVCHLYATDPAYNRLYGGDGIHPGPDPLTRAKNLLAASAQHAANHFRVVGAEEYDLRKSICAGCEYFKPKSQICGHQQCGCGVTGKGLLAKLGVDKLAWESASCPRQKWPVQTTMRHLLMHVYPRRNNDAWRWNLDQIFAHIDLFNGARVIAVATDSTTDSLETVQAYAGDRNIDWIHVENNRSLREVASFLQLLERVETQARGHATFYCHAKGVTTGANTARDWTRIMYETLVGRWDLVERELWRKPIVGSFMQRHPGFQHSKARWYYGGSFYWFRNDALFSRNWRDHDHTWYGVEPYPGVHFAEDEAGCVFWRGEQGRHFDLYNRQFVDSQVLPEYERWKQAHPCPTAGPSSMGSPPRP